MKILSDANAEICAADQDSSGFAHSCDDKKTEWIIVRGVSDFGDRDIRKEKAIYATIAAASLVRYNLAHSYRLSIKENEGELTEDDKLLDKMQNLLGCTNIWVPVDKYKYRENSERNNMKSFAIGKSREAEIRLLAETGFSYISLMGQFYDDIYNHLKQDGSFRVILGRATDEVVRTEAEKENIEAKLNMALAGFKELSKEFGDQIELKITDIQIAGTILITDRYCFFEPYVHSKKMKRKKFVSFDMLFDKQKAKHGYQLMKGYFDQFSQ